jgi:hypothetical protein
LGSSNTRKSLLSIIAFLVLTIVEIASYIAVEISFNGNESSKNLIIYLGLTPLFFTTLVMLSVIIGLRIKRKRQEKWHQTDQDILMEKDITQKESKEKIKLVFEPIVFQGDRENQICSLCHKTVKEGHVTLICPRCAPLFHHDHLLGWLEDNPLCPVCNEDL